jgi:hypothetical protein
MLDAGSACAVVMTGGREKLGGLEAGVGVTAFQHSIRVSRLPISA